MSLEDSSPINSILVCGAGLVGLSAALAFARALPHANVRVLELDHESIALTDLLPGTLPQIRFFHKLIGLEESRVLRHSSATHRLGTLFRHWHQDSRTWLHTFGRCGVPIRSSSFQHQWVRMHARGRALPFDRYSPAAALARAGKFAEPKDDERSLLSSFDYALRLDPELYRSLLIDEAVRARVSFIRGTIAEVRQGERARVTRLVLADGSELRADLFIDCGGPTAPVLSAVEDKFEDWREYLPCDRVLIGKAAAVVPTAVDTVTATDEGWSFDIPLLARTVRGAAYSSALVEDDAVRAEHMHESQSDSLELIRLRPGRRTETWVGNVLAFGEAAFAIDPLQSSNLSLAHSAIRRALSLLPGTEFHPLVLEEFNRRTRLETDRVRDFVSLHYLRAKRTTGEFWASMRERSLPDSLEHTIEQFEERGRLPKYEEETFEDDSWLAVLFGLGVVPRRIDPTVYRVPEPEVASMMGSVERMSAELASKLPPYHDYLRAMLTRQ